eukprot:GHVH01006522.1.p1 GENE.GHVH01006522.1~~GHVH01006522.1.p1  ORF type:complete len:395 (+),score=48.11 GHVH01006522.1:34-1218(+)
MKVRDRDCDRNSPVQNWTHDDHHDVKRSTSNGTTSMMCEEYAEVVVEMAGLSASNFERIIKKLHKECYDHGMMKLSKRKGRKVVMTADLADSGTVFVDKMHNQQFHLVSKIGTGNSGDVFISLDSQGRSHAIKLVRFYESLNATKRAVSRLLQEASFHHYLEKYDPANKTEIARCSAIVLPKHTLVPYVGILMPYKGISLDKISNSFQGIPFSSDFIIRLTRRLLTTLDCLHRLGITHGDLKLGNILLYSKSESPGKAISCNDARKSIFKTDLYQNHIDEWRSISTNSKASAGLLFFQKLGDKVIDVDEDFTVHLIDLGASVFTNNYKNGQRICGTFHLKPPEDLTGDQRSKSVYKRDIWALGLIVFQLWCGHQYQPHRHKVSSTFLFQCSISR